MDSKIIIEKLDRALYLTSADLIHERVEIISSLIHSREWIVGFEILCSNLHDFEVPISKETYQLLEDVGTQLKTENDYHEDLKPQIIPDS